MTRRIKRDLQKFFDEKPLTSQEKYFILGCIGAQDRHPQLTSKQWKIVCEIEEKYKNGKSE
jgi:hypothetical protein